MAEHDSDSVEPADEPEDLETAYRLALEAIESAESEVGRAFGELADAPDEAETDEAGRESATVDAEAPSTIPIAVDSPGALQRRITPLGIIEAALFVGGTELTTKRLVRMLNGEFDADRIAGFVDELNDRYTRDGRPYEIDFGEGGFRLALRSEFDDVRNRVFGLGPREIKLSQPALEMLSLVAYQQPIDRETIDHHGGKSGMAMLRQLIRRELVELHRDDDGDAVYRTTDRFLDVFGIADLDELPRAVELEMK